MICRQEHSRISSKVETTEIPFESLTKVHIMFQMNSNRLLSTATRRRCSLDRPPLFTSAKQQVNPFRCPIGPLHRSLRKLSTCAKLSFRKFPIQSINNTSRSAFYLRRALSLQAEHSTRRYLTTKPWQQERSEQKWKRLLPDKQGWINIAWLYGTGLTLMGFYFGTRAFKVYFNGGFSSPADKDSSDSCDSA